MYMYNLLPVFAQLTHMEYKKAQMELPPTGTT